MEHEQIKQRHGMIDDGLRKICRTFLNFHHKKKNDGKFVDQIENLQNIELGDQEQQFFFNINTAVIIQWLIESLGGQIKQALFRNQSEKDVIFTLLRMAQTSRFVKAHSLMPKISTSHTQIVQLLLRNFHSQYSVQSAKILDQKQQCSILSENITKIKSIMLAQRKLIDKNALVLLGKIIWIDLNSLFLNILLNLNRVIKRINDVIPYNLEKLKIAQLYIHYLWITNFIRTQPFIQRIRQQPDSSLRKKTHIYLLYDKRGLSKINSYLQEVSFIQIQNQIDYLYQKIEESIK